MKNPFTALKLCYAGLLTLTFATSMRGQSFEKIGDPYVLAADQTKNGAAAAEVAVDPGGIEIGWRAHFGFYGKVAAETDTDGDGINDAEEAKRWTNPLAGDADVERLSPDQRRLAAMTSYMATPILVDGKIATPAEVLAREEAEGFELARSLGAASSLANARADAWSKRTGQSLHQGGKGLPNMVVIDAEGDRPIVWADLGTVSNNFSMIPPLWPGGSVGSNVTGYVGLLNGIPVRKNCGLWEVYAPRVTHQELSGRISVLDNAYFDAEKSYHATFVAGIIAASGVSPAYLGSAYEGKIFAYSSANNFAEMAGLPNATVQEMRASNHSYGKLNGWGPPLQGGGSLWRFWGGNFAQASAATNWEDYRFGLYTSDAATADTTARNKAYHLMVKAAGNDKLDDGTIENANVRTVNVIRNGLILGYGWCYSLYDNDLILVEYQYGNRFIYASHVINYDYQAAIAYIDDNTPVYSLPESIVLSPDGNSYNNASGFDSLSEGFGVAKNTLSVGAMVDNVTISPFSAAGPTDDGRIKPDVMALGGGGTGFHLSGLGASSDSDYSSSASGTSFAAPAVAGAVTLLSQYQENLRSGKEPLRSSTFKALLCHTANDVGVPGPDYQSGWGVVNAGAAAEMIKTNNQRRKITEVFLDNGQSATAKVRAIGGQPIKVTISWNDPAGAVQPNSVDPPGDSGSLKVLKNDLNLKVTRTLPLSSEIHYPYQPNPAAPWDAAGLGVNNRDTVEQVFIPYPNANEDYEIQIQQQSGTTLTGGGQWVSVIMSGVTSPGPAELAVQSVSFQPYYGGYTQCSVVFSSVLGGYYKLQYVPYGAAPGSWQDVPGVGVIYSRADLCYSSFFLSPSNPVPVRVIAVSPNPFNLP